SVLHVRPAALADRSHIEAVPFSNELNLTGTQAVRCWISCLHSRVLPAAAILLLKGLDQGCEDERSEIVRHISPAVLKMLREELLDSPPDLFSVGFEREVACVQQVSLKILEVTCVRRRAFRGEDGIVLAPHDQCWWLVLAKESLKLGIERYV